MRTHATVRCGGGIGSDRAAESRFQPAWANQPRASLAWTTFNIAKPASACMCLVCAAPTRDASGRPRGGAAGRCGVHSQLFVSTRGLGLTESEIRNRPNGRARAKISCIMAFSLKRDTGDSRRLEPGPQSAYTRAPPGRHSAGRHAAGHDCVFTRRSGRICVWRLRPLSRQRKRVGMEKRRQAAPSPASAARGSIRRGHRKQRLMRFGAARRGHG